MEQSCTGDVGLGALEKRKGISTIPHKRDAISLVIERLGFQTPADLDL